MLTRQTISCGALMSVSDGLQRLGDMAGKSEKDFVDALGRGPHMISELAGGHRLLQWRSGRYNIQAIAVLFDAGHRFVKITSRYHV